MKKIISLLLCAILICSMFVTATAANELAGAKNFTLGGSKSGSITEKNKSDVYKFTLPTSGVAKLSVQADFEYIHINIYDEACKSIWDHYEQWNSTLESLNYQKNIELTHGTYYISVEGKKAYSSINYFGNYNLNLNFESANESFDDAQGGSNNTIREASPINLNQKYNGHIAVNDEKDIYSFNLSSSSNVELAIEGNLEYIHVNIYDGDGKNVWEHYEQWNETKNYFNYQENIELTQGTYYISVEGKKAYSSVNYFGNYNLNLNFESANESFDDAQGGSNNTIREASPINLNQKYNGHIAVNDEKDIYSFNLSSSSNVELAIEGNLEYIHVNIYDGDGNNVWEHYEQWNSTLESLNYQKNIELTQGTYYISVEGKKAYSSANYFGKYSFYVSNGGIIIETSIPIPPTEISVLVNGEKISFDQPPILENGRTLVPLRAIFEALGADVQWDGNTQTVTATKGGIKISLQIGSNQMYVNGGAKTLDVPAKLINSRTLVPVRAISEAFGCKVDWIDNTQTVVITQ